MFTVLSATGDLAGPNLYIDTILQNVTCILKNDGEEFLSIPDHVVGSVQLTEGQISGLDTLRRKGEARMHSDADGATIEAKLVLEQVRLCYDYTAKVLFAKNQGKISVCAGEIETFIRVHQTSDLNKSPVLQEFVIRQLRGLRANMSGLGPVSWLVNRLQRTLLNIFSIRIQDLLQEKVHGLIQTELNKFSLADISMRDLMT
ncbi:mite allergen Lep d 7-like [Pollicipes pollicipes]|uniref:mite allergen Lep d 7-like n=1 Tax=Pollicipes pollicipes TaxID=41117 RepID=UPI0018851341|nr:mite allergen Lep d 7-like [Pollicipes pollicipes]